MKNRIIVVIVGLIFAGIGLFILFNNDRLKKVCTSPVDGKVVGYTESFDDGSFTYCPVIEYYVRDKKITKQHSSCSSSKKYNENQTIKVLYNPEKVEEYIISGESSSSILSYIFIGTGILIVILGIVGKVGENTGLTGRFTNE